MAARRLRFGQQHAHRAGCGNIIGVTRDGMRAALGRLLELEAAQTAELARQRIFDGMQSIDASRGVPVPAPSTVAPTASPEAIRLMSCRRRSTSCVSRPASSALNASM